MSSQSEPLKKALRTAIGLLAIVGIWWIVSGALPTGRFELMNGGYVTLVRTSWWGMREKRFLVRLQDTEWFVQAKTGDWSRVDFR